MNKYVTSQRESQNQSINLYKSQISLLLRDILQMKKILVVTIVISLLFSETFNLYTSSYWLKKGIDVRDGKVESSPIISTQTECNSVDLNVDPYKYQGVVKSGYLMVGKGNSTLNFIFYGRQNTVETDLVNYPIVIWLNGGPGSSSQLGNFMELGPFYIRPQTLAPYEIIKNNNSWIKEYNVLFVDQPVGTGLSYADPTQTNKSFCTDMDCVATDFYNALHELYLNNNGCFKQIGFKPDHNFIIFGQSYAGKYAPAIGQKIVREMKQSQGFLTGLKGVAIGDGFTHPYEILTEVGEYAYNLGLLDYQQRSAIQQIILNATYQERSANNHRNPNQTEKNQYWSDLHDSFDQVLDLIVTMGGDINVYDITKFGQYPTALVGQYLKSDEAIKLYHLNPNIVFNFQSGSVYQYMYIDFMKQYITLVESLLEYNINVMIYNGQNDLIVQTPGTFKWAQKIYYANSDQFKKTLFSVWKVGNITAGYIKSVGKLQLRTVNNAGHLVPMDQGEAALQMVKQFMNQCLK